MLLAATTATAFVSRSSDWQPFEVFVILLVFAVVSDAFILTFREIRISGSFLAIVLAMALLGPAPAVVIGVSAVIADALRTRLPRAHALTNIANYATFPLLGGLALRWVGDRSVEPTTVWFALCVLAVFIAANVLNFLLAVASMLPQTTTPLARRFRTEFVPMLPVELATGLLTTVIVIAYHWLGIAILGLVAVVGLVFQILLRTTFESVERGEQLERRTTELASLQVGLITTVLQTLSLRDRMTARHSAAVARYAREMAKELGLSERDQEVVHTAGLLHDIGKFIFPDSILFADSKLTDEEFAIIKKHPEQGAKLVRKIEGYGPVAEIIHAHHERIDGRGYPRGLLGPEIPLASRIISIADTYDVMTSRDSYRTPVSSAEAFAELRRVSGAQLDGELVEMFIRLVEQRSIAFRHADDADFEAELNFERRVRDYAQPVVG